jgi:hypothetical protein
VTEGEAVSRIWPGVQVSPFAAAALFVFVPNPPTRAYWGDRSHRIGQVFKGRARR